MDLLQVSHLQCSSNTYEISLSITFVLYYLGFSVMALNLAFSQHDLIHDIIVNKKLKSHQMGEVAKCSERLIKVMRLNMHDFGTHHSN